MPARAVRRGKLLDLRTVHHAVACKPLHNLRAAEVEPPALLVVRKLRRLSVAAAGLLVDGGLGNAGELVDGIDIKDLIGGCGEEAFDRLQTVFDTGQGLLYGHTKAPVNDWLELFDKSNLGWEGKGE